VRYVERVHSGRLRPQGGHERKQRLCARARHPFPANTLSVAIDSKGDVAISGIFEGALGLAHVNDPYDASTWGGSSQADETSYLVKLDGRSGTGKWGYATHSSADGNNIGYLAADSLGNVYMAAGFWTTLTFPGAPSPMTSAGSTDAYVVKVDVDGNYLWSQRYGGSSWEASSGIAIDPCSGGPVVSGTLTSVVTFESAYDGGLLTLDGTGAQEAGASSSDIFFAHLAP
jgi:hypothetical protein